VAAGARRRHVEEDHRRAALEADHLELQALHLLALDPRGGVADDAVDEAVRLPLGVERRALGGHLDVLGDLRDDLVVPNALGEAAERLGLVLLDRLQRIACVHRGLLVVGVGFSVSSQAVRTLKTSFCSGSLKISWKSDAKGRAVTIAAGAAAANAALPAGTTRRSLPAYSSS